MPRHDEMRLLAGYCKRHRISFDWMLDGDLKGLQAMMDARRGRVAAAKPASLMDNFSRLSKSEREAVLKAIEEIGT